MKKFLKGKLAKNDKGGDQLRSSWTGVHSSTKGKSIADILSFDKREEEKDNISKNLNWFHAGTNRNLAESKLREGKAFNYMMTMSMVMECSFINYRGVVKSWVTFFSPPPLQTAQIFLMVHPSQRHRKCPSPLLFEVTID